MINLCSYFTDKKYGRHFDTPTTKNAYEHIANPKNASMIKAACIHLEVIKRVMSSSSSSSSPPCSPFFPSLVGLSGGTSQHHQLIGLCNLYLIMVCALIQLCMLAIPSIIPFGEKRSWRVCICKSFWGPKKTQYFTWISSSPVIGFLLFFGGILADFWSSGEIIFMQNTCCWYLEIQTLRRTNESLNQSHKYNFGSPHSAPLSIPFNFCQQDLATTGDVLSNLHS